MRHANTAMLDAVDAYYAEREIPGEQLPSAWTIEHVMARLVEAFEILMRAGGSVGPKEFGTNWPNIVREFAELVDAQAYAEHEKAGARVKLRATVEQVSRMEEALRWPAQFLADNPLAADAISLWAACTARGTSIKAVLRTRNAEAVRVAKIMEEDANRQRDADRKAEARIVAEWAEARIAQSDGTAGAAHRIKANASIRLERALRAKGILAPRIIVKPSAAMPSKVVSQTSMDRHRYVAARAISEGLQQACAPIR